MLAIFTRALRATLRKASPSAPRGSEIGAIAFPQRFGNSLNPHYHFHVLAVDGVFSAIEAHDDARGPAGVRFHEAARLGPQPGRELERTVQKRVLRAFRRRGLLDVGSWLDDAVGRRIATQPLQERAMGDSDAEVPGAAAGPCAGPMMEVWPRSDLAGSAGQGHGFMGRRPAMTSRRGADPGAPGRRA